MRAVDEVAGLGRSGGRQRLGSPGRPGPGLARRRPAASRPLASADSDPKADEEGEHGEAPFALDPSTRWASADAHSVPFSAIGIEVTGLHIQIARPHDTKDPIGRERDHPTKHLFR